MVAETRVLRMFLATVMWINAFQRVRGALTPDLLGKIAEANRRRPYIGSIVPNAFELNPLLHSPYFTSTDADIDFAGKRFRFGAICDQPVMVFMTGLSRINAAVTTQLLLSFFQVKGVALWHCGKCEPIPEYWRFTNSSILGTFGSLELRYGQGPEDELPLEASGDYTREIGYLKFADYTTSISDGSSYDNQLNNIWYQPKEIFPIDGTPEERQHAFWIPVDSMFFQMSQKLSELRLERCFNSTCLLRGPKVARVQRGGSASIFLSNSAYRSFIYNKFNVCPIDMESASVALICLQQRASSIAFRAVSGTKSIPLASMNSVTLVVEFIKQWSQLRLSL